MKNYYKEVNDAFREKYERAVRESEEKKEFLRGKIPALREIDALLAATGTKVIAAAMDGTDVEQKIAAIRKENEELTARRRALLRENGYPEDYSDVKYDCPLCFDSGFVGIDMCSCMKSAISDARLADSDMGRLAATQSFDSFSFSYYTGKDLEMVKSNYDKLRSFAESFDGESGESFLLVGATGLGKTHLSTAVGVTVIRRGYDVVYKSVQSMLEDFETAQFRGGDPESLRNYYDCDLLIIDDLGVELSNQFTVSCLYNVINSRINSRRSTIFSTNLTQSELREKYADRITSRLFGEYKPLLFSGVDVRRQKLKGN